MFSIVPHALQCTASLSWRCRPQVGQGNRTLLGVKRARARLKSSVTPKIIMTTEIRRPTVPRRVMSRSEEHTSELQSPCNIVCRLLLEKKIDMLVIFDVSLMVRCGLSLKQCIT